MINGERYSLAARITQRITQPITQQARALAPFLLHHLQLNQLKVFNYHLASPFLQVEDVHPLRKVQVHHLHR